MTNAEAQFKAAVQAVLAGGETKVNAASLGLKSLSGQQTRWRNEVVEAGQPGQPGQPGDPIVAGIVQKMYAPEPQISEPVANGDAIECPAPAPAKRERKPKAERQTPASKDPATSPTALARQMIARRAADETILAATKEKFGKGTKQPVLFTAADLKRLRARLK